MLRQHIRGNPKPGGGSGGGRAPALAPGGRAERNPLSFFIRSYGGGAREANPAAHLTRPTASAGECCWQAGRSSSLQCESVFEGWDPRPVRQININNRKVWALLDTGSSATLIKSSVAKMMGLQPEDLASPRVGVSLTTASGEALDFEGSFRGTVSFGEKSAMCDILVVKNLRRECILGIDAMAGLGLTMKLTGAECEVSEVCKGRERPMMIKVKREYTIPARSTKWCKVEFAGQGDLLIWDQAVGPDAMVEAGIIGPGPGKAYQVPITNVSDWPIVVAAGARVAAAEARDLRIESVDLDKLYLDKSVKEVPKPKGKGGRVPEDTFAEVPAAWRERFRDLFLEFEDVVSRDRADVGRCTVHTQKLELKDPSAVTAAPPIRVPEHLKPVVRDFVEKMLAAKIIRHSTSEFSSPILLVKKPGVAPERPLQDQYRIVHDYRSLNLLIRPIKSAGPNVTELIDRVAGCKFISVCDLTQSFYSLPLDEASKKLTAFTVGFMGLALEYNTTSMGLINSSAALAKVMAIVLRHLPGVFYYCDDIIQAHNSIEEHYTGWRHMLMRFREYGLKINPSKIQLIKESINFLGYDIKPGVSIQAGELKIKAIQQFEVPNSVSKIRSFISLCSYFRKTIPRFADIAAPLTELTRKGAFHGQMNEEARKAFFQLKKALTSRPCLRPIDFEKPFIVFTDASQKGIGAILAQKVDGQEHPCMYASRALKAAEVKMGAYGRELAGLVFGVTAFRPYLLGSDFTLRCDHLPLVTMSNKISPVYERLLLTLQSYMPFKLEHMDGTKMPSDALSRFGFEEIEIKDQEEASSKRQARKGKGAKEASAEAARPSGEEGGPRGTCARDGEGLLSGRVLQQLQKQDKLCKALTCYLWFSRLPEDEESRKHCMALAGKYHMDEKLLKLNSGEIIAPAGVRATIMSLAHRHPLAGHPGALRMKRALENKFFWPGMDDDIKEMVQGCHECQAANPPANMKPLPLEPMPKLTGPMQRVHADLLALPTTERGNKYALVMVDAFTRWCQLIAIKSKEMEEVAEAMIENWMSVFLLPAAILTDQGTEFANSLTTQLWSRFQVRTLVTSAGHPQANSAAERINRDLINYLRKYYDKDYEWDKQLKYFQAAHNSSWHSALGTSPYFMLFANHPRVMFSPEWPEDRYREDALGDIWRRLRKAYEIVEAREEARQQQNSKQQTKMAEERSFEVGDQVFVSHPTGQNRPKKLQNSFFGPFVVVERAAHNNYWLKKNFGKRMMKIHANRMKLVRRTSKSMEENGADETTKDQGRRQEKTDNEEQEVIKHSNENEGNNSRNQVLKVRENNLRRSKRQRNWKMANEQKEVWADEDDEEQSANNRLGDGGSGSDFANSSTGRATPATGEEKQEEQQELQLQAQQMGENKKPEKSYAGPRTRSVVKHFGFKLFKN